MKVRTTFEKLDGEVIAVHITEHQGTTYLLTRLADEWTVAFRFGTAKPRIAAKYATLKQMSRLCNVFGTYEDLLRLTFKLDLVTE